MLPAHHFGQRVWWWPIHGPRGPWTTSCSVPHTEHFPLFVFTVPPCRLLVSLNHTERRKYRSNLRVAKATEIRFPRSPDRTSVGRSIRRFLAKPS